MATWIVLLAAQTNGTLIDSRFIEFCRRYSISFGVSLDSLPDVHERTRGSAGATYRGLQLFAWADYAGAHH
ncbi:hypothetical protein [Desulforhabdus amnigena]|uniref:Uncharacterized protein n=1 Tax=Desulforhabdus amnigena TaxID=40218 RepID=A0A9W6FUH2_9BACT|nr:hypothetical protein [Desulforhabdus amnigena]NLJ27564.1 hypothetical protein [Deltaproteobacteria bacterium]GLI35087.1 hypothetical protein DAMNIGENAA_25200 [Desulforhabdus amnigena]